MKEKYCWGQTVPNVFVATTSKRLKRARSAMNYFRHAGCTIAFDWAKDIEEERGMSKFQLSERALKDIHGVQKATVLVVIMLKEMETSMTGASIEMGAAFGSDIPVIIVEEEVPYVHFYRNHPGVNVCRFINNALDLIKGFHP